MEKILKGICVAASAISGVVVYWLGGLDKLLIALLAVIVLDFITGLAKGARNKNLSSAVGFAGIARKVMALSIVALAFVLEGLIAGAFPLREIVIMFFIANEGLSILENAADAGIPLPPKLKDVLGQLKGGENVK